MNPAYASNVSSNCTARKGVAVKYKEKEVIIQLTCIKYKTIAAIFKIHGKAIFLNNRTNKILIKIEDAQNGGISDGDTVVVVAKNNNSKAMLGVQSSDDSVRTEREDDCFLFDVQMKPKQEILETKLTENQPVHVLVADVDEVEDVKGVTLKFGNRKVTMPLNSINYETVTDKDINLSIESEELLINVDNAQCGIISDGDEVCVVLKNRVKVESCKITDGHDDNEKVNKKTLNTRVKQDTLSFVEQLCNKKQVQLEMERRRRNWAISQMSYNDIKRKKLDEKVEWAVNKAMTQWECRCQNKNRNDIEIIDHYRDKYNTFK